MFIVCIECFQVITEQYPLDSSAVIPSFCPSCRGLGDMKRRRLGLMPQGLPDPPSGTELEREERLGRYPT